MEIESVTHIVVCENPNGDYPPVNYGPFATRAEAAAWMHEPANQACPNNHVADYLYSPKREG